MIGVAINGKISVISHCIIAIHLIDNNSNILRHICKGCNLAMLHGKDRSRISFVARPSRGQLNRTLARKSHHDFAANSLAFSLSKSHTERESLITITQATLNNLLSGVGCTGIGVRQRRNLGRSSTIRQRVSVQNCDLALQTSLGSQIFAIFIDNMNHQEQFLRVMIHTVGSRSDLLDLVVVSTNIGIGRQLDFQFVSNCNALSCSLSGCIGDGQIHSRGFCIASQRSVLHGICFASAHIQASSVRSPAIASILQLNRNSSAIVRIRRRASGRFRCKTRNCHRCHHGHSHDASKQFFQFHLDSSLKYVGCKIHTKLVQTLRRRSRVMTLASSSVRGTAPKSRLSSDWVR